MKKLIINADDFWMSKIYNKEIIDLAKRNIISSISVMTKRWIENQIEDVEELKKSCNLINISIGLHLEFLQKEENYKEEINKQLKSFYDSFWFQPNHIDIHKDIPTFEFDEKCTRQVIAFANSMKIPSRNRANILLSEKHTDWSMFIVSKKPKEDVFSRLSSLENGKSYELVCHPGRFDPEIQSSLNKEREDDVKMILHINELKEKMNIEIVSFKDL